MTRRKRSPSVELLHKFYDAKLNKRPVTPTDMCYISREDVAALRMRRVPLLWLPEQGVWEVSYNAEKVQQWSNFDIKNVYSRELHTLTALSRTELPTSIRDQRAVELIQLGHSSGKSLDDVKKDMEGPKVPPKEREYLDLLLQLMDDMPEIV